MSFKTGVFVTLGILIGIPALTVKYGVNSYNNIVTYEENVNESYAQYQSMIKRQSDLLPNLANVTKGFMTAEQKTMIDVAVARAGDAAKMKPSDVANNPELQKTLVEAQSKLGQAMVAINAVREAYPQLKSSTHVTGLMNEIAGSQNRVTVARGNNQKAVGEYNRYIRGVPVTFLAKAYDFKSKPYYEAPAEDQNVPKINF